MSWGDINVSMASFYDMPTEVARETCARHEPEAIS